PIDYHIKGFKALGAQVLEDGDMVMVELASAARKKVDRRVIFEYPSVGATENLMLCAAALSGSTTIVNAAFEPEVLDLVEVLRKMGVKIEFILPHAIKIYGCDQLKPIEHAILPDRMEAGSLLCAIAATGGEGGISNAQPENMELFLEKLREMGHSIEVGPSGKGIWLTACKKPQAVSFKTAPYPGFPTDLQAPMMAVQLGIQGTAVVTETVYDGRFGHVEQFCKMGANIKISGQRAIVECGNPLSGVDIIALDIRAAYALLIAGLTASGSTKLHGIHHLQRGYDRFAEKLQILGGKIIVKDNSKKLMKAL
ncbi:UDP-N-acetylglucosamine 1-carboxyvinyltransferase, partial [Candidatus Babeliales bacterium]|nr:UDP-N-acetylglucosamine 1-carboxyvinyltransferase [Candidatus Babeliales bacterium]